MQDDTIINDLFGMSPSVYDLQSLRNNKATIDFEATLIAGSYRVVFSTDYDVDPTVLIHSHRFEELPETLVFIQKIQASQIACLNPTYWREI